MDNAYILQKTDRTEEDYIMPTFTPDPHPNDPLGPLIVIRVISPNTDPTCSMEFDTTWESMRRKARFGTIMTAGQGYWWEEKGKWLHPEESPDQIGLEHGNIVRVVLCKVPVGKADVLDVEFEKKETEES